MLDDGLDSNDFIAASTEIEDYLEFFEMPPTEERRRLLAEALKLGSERQALYDRYPLMPKAPPIHVIYNPVTAMLRGWLIGVRATEGLPMATSFRGL